MALSKEEKERRQLERRKKRYEETHKLVDGIDYKLCNNCNEWLPCNSEYYYKNKSNGIDGYNPYCKNCAIEKASKWQDQNKDKHSKSQMKYAKTEKGKRTVLKESRKWRLNGGQREYYIQNKEKFLMYRIRNRKVKNHDITDEEWFACLDYFNNSCAYCGLSETDQFKFFNQQLHREHVNHSGSNYIENCVPACTTCNTSKHDIEFNEWYNENNESFSKRRLNKIIRWMTNDCLYVLNVN